MVMLHLCLSFRSNLGIHKCYVRCIRLNLFAVSYPCFFANLRSVPRQWFGLTSTAGPRAGLSLTAPVYRVTASYNNARDVSAIDDRFDDSVFLGNPLSSRC